MWAARGVCDDVCDDGASLSVWHHFPNNSTGVNEQPRLRRGVENQSARTAAYTRRKSVFIFGFRKESVSGRGYAFKGAEEGETSTREALWAGADEPSSPAEHRSAAAAGGLR